MEINMQPLNKMDLKGKTVLCRLDINSPIDPTSKKIVNENRIYKSIPTLSYLIDQGAKIAIIAHQGDTLDYQNLTSLEQHAQKLSTILDKNVDYIDDVCGPAAQQAIKNLKESELIILGNLRYLGEELSTFEKDVTLSIEQMTQTWLVRSLSKIVDVYVNDAFAAAHRNAPSMVAFQELLPTGAGLLLFDEYEALSKVLHGVKKPAIFILGGAKISDAFGMIDTVLKNKTADKILTTGITGLVMLMASGAKLGNKTEEFLKSKDLLGFIDQAKQLLIDFSDNILYPKDLAFEENGQRIEININQMPKETLFQDIGTNTIQIYNDIISKAGTIFANGPAGVYENPIFEKGSKKIWQSVTKSESYSVIGGGDTVNSASQFIDLNDISYVCTAGGAMVRFMSGKKLPLIAAMEKAYERDSKK